MRRMCDLETEARAVLWPAVDTEEFFGKRSQSETKDDGETADAAEAAASSEEPSGDTK